MNEKEFLKKLILKDYHTLEDFSKETGMNLNYLRSILSGKEIVSVKTKEKVLEHLSITYVNFKLMYNKSLDENEPSVDMRPKKTIAKQKLSQDVLDFMKKFHAAYAASDTIHKYIFRDAYNASFDLKK